MVSVVYLKYRVLTGMRMEMGLTMATMMKLQRTILGLGKTEKHQSPKQTRTGAGSLKSRDINNRTSAY